MSTLTECSIRNCTLTVAHRCKRFCIRALAYAGAPKAHRLHYPQRTIGGGVERSTLSIADRAVATHTAASGVSDLYRMYGLAKPDGVGLRLAFSAPSQ
jgi:hypothetical protein